VSVKSGSVVFKKKGGKEIMKDMYWTHQGTVDYACLDGIHVHNVIIIGAATVMEELGIKFFIQVLECNVE